MTGNVVECLLIEENNITIRREGKNKGKGNYGFLVTAIDAGNSGDQIKITIWDKLNGDKVIYDNLTMNELGGGYITIINSQFVKEDNDITAPEEFSLEQNYPNPFNPSTTIRFDLTEKEYVSLKVYDVMGNEVAVFLNEEKPVGSHSVDFDATGLASGTYFYKLQAGSLVETKKMILMK